MKSFIPTTCDPYWEGADWLPPWYILERWCQRDEACIQAKLQATATIFIFIFNPSANQEHLTQTLRVVYVELPATHPALVSR